MDEFKQQITAIIEEITPGNGYPFFPRCVEPILKASDIDALPLRGVGITEEPEGCLCIHLNLSPGVAETALRTFISCAILAAGFSVDRGNEGEPITVCKPTLNTEQEGKADDATEENRDDRSESGNDDRDPDCDNGD
jgi:hypothetical protein